MKYFLFLLLISSGNAFSQNLSAEEQRQLMNDVKELKNKVNKLESEKSQKGLKTVDYKGGTTENTDTSKASAGPSLTPEQTKEFMETLQKAKAQQEAQAKALKEIEDEE